jgi:acyl dehydratase
MWSSGEIMIFYEDVMLNQEEKSREYTIEKEEIISYAKQWDPQPFHIDEEEAAKWPLGLTASSLHSYAIANKLGMEISSEPPAMVAGLGVDEMRMTAPVKPGDQLHVVRYIESKRESKSNPSVGIVTSMKKLINQNGEVVISYKTSSLIKKKADNQNT